MTHGRILIKEKGFAYHLYAYHDGHTEQALRDLLELPWLLFERSRLLAKQPQLHDSIKLNGPWFYGVLLDNLERYKGKPRREVERMARSMTFLELSGLSLANWMAWRHFDHWLVVSDPAACPYPGKHPDLTVRVEHDSYQVTSQDPDRNQPEFSTRLVEAANQVMAARNASVGESAHIFTVNRDTTRSMSSNPGRAAALPWYKVPFDNILIDLAWRALQEDEKPVRPHATALIIST